MDWRERERGTGKKDEKDSAGNRATRCTRQMKEQLHSAAGVHREDEKRRGPWAPCEIIITLHDPRHNAV